jgi:hypothetical protein
MYLLNRKNKLTGYLAYILTFNPLKREGSLQFRFKKWSARIEQISWLT